MAQESAADNVLQLYVGSGPGSLHFVVGQLSGVHGTHSYKHRQAMRVVECIVRRVRRQDLSGMLEGYVDRICNGPLVYCLGQNRYAPLEEDRICNT